MMRLIRPILAVLLVALASCQSPGGRARWIGTYQSSPVGMPTAFKLETLALPRLETIKGTIRYRLRISQGGEKVRIKVANEFSDRPLVIQAASLGVAGEKLDAVPGSLRSLTFAGRTSTTLPVGAVATSDPVDLAIPALANLVISLHVPEGIKTPPSPQASKSNPGLATENATLAERWSEGPHYQVRPLVSAIEVLARGRTGVVVTIGDSITDAWVDGKTGDRGWSGALARRLENEKVAVVNAGINSNRVLKSGSYFAPSAVARLDRDVFSVPGLTHLIVYEGINDIGMNSDEAWAGPGEVVKAGDMIAGYRRIIARAHARRIRVFGATILPFSGAFYFSEEKERVRLAVNEWIRTAKEFDAVIDFDAALRDPERPACLRKEFDSGDHLHPNAEGQRQMGNTIDLGLFKP